MIAIAIIAVTVAIYYVGLNQPLDKATNGNIKLLIIPLLIVLFVLLNLLH